MTHLRTEDRISGAGYALGIGLAFVPLIGIPLRFMLPDLPALLSFSAAFAAGLLLGGLLGRRRKSPG